MTLITTKDIIISIKFFDVAFLTVVCRLIAVVLKRQKPRVYSHGLV